MKIETALFFGPLIAVLAASPRAQAGGYDFKLSGGHGKVGITCESSCGAWSALAFACSPRADACEIGINSQGLGIYDMTPKWDVRLVIDASSDTVSILCRSRFCEIETGAGDKKEIQALSPGEKRSLPLPVKVMLRFQ